MWALPSVKTYVDLLIFIFFLVIPNGCLLGIPTKKFKKNCGALEKQNTQEFKFLKFTTNNWGKITLGKVPLLTLQKLTQVFMLKQNQNPHMRSNMDQTCMNRVTIHHEEHHKNIQMIWIKKIGLKQKMIFFKCSFFGLTISNTN